MSRPTSPLHRSPGGITEEQAARLTNLMETVQQSQTEMQKLWEIVQLLHYQLERGLSMSPLGEIGDPRFQSTPPRAYDTMYNDLDLDLPSPPMSREQYNQLYAEVQRTPPRPRTPPVDLNRALYNFPTPTFSPGSPPWMIDEVCNLSGLSDGPGTPEPQGVYGQTLQTPPRKVELPIMRLLYK